MCSSDLTEQVAPDVSHFGIASRGTCHDDDDGTSASHQYAERLLPGDRFLHIHLISTTPVKDQGNSELCWAYGMLATILSFSPKFEAVINTIPTGIIGGISFVLYGMISAIGVRNVVENRVDFTNSRNLIVAAVILVCALGFNSVGGVSFAVAGVTINLSGLAVAAIAGILLNAILPGNDYEFDAADGSEAATSSNLQV